MAVDLYWIPLGAGGRFVRRNGRVYEAIAAARAHRRPRDLYHAALIVDGHAIEIAPTPDRRAASRGVVASGPVGSRWLGGLRWFRYEIRCGRSIPDLAFAVGGACRVSDDREVAARILRAVRTPPTLTWGRDELGAGEMWNSNSLVAWLLSASGVDAGALHPPPGGRAPGWDAGVALGSRAWASTPTRSSRASSTASAT
jgi:hypothetical protein